MSSLRVVNVTKRFGNTVAVDDVSFEVKEGEFFCILGPTRAGKTTTLRTIAGLEEPDAGSVFIDDEDVTGVHPRERDTALFFQDVALYPHFSGFDNIAFPLRQRKVSDAEVRRRVGEVADLLHVHHLLDRKPATYSGGERQRVALGRVLIRRPRVYLLDEPLSNLDAKLRLEMRAELKHLQRDLGQTTIYVTPDQVEAMAMGDRLLVLRQGRVQQVGTPIEVYDRPATQFVASFIGSPPMNFLRCQLCRRGEEWWLEHRCFNLCISTLAAQLPGVSEGETLFAIRPEDIRIANAADSAATVQARVYVSEHLGRHSVVDFDLADDLLKALAPEFSRFQIGEQLSLQFNLQRAHLIDPATGQVLV